MVIKLASYHSIPSIYFQDDVVIVLCVPEDSAIHANTWSIASTLKPARRSVDGRAYIVCNAVKPCNKISLEIPRHSTGL